MVKQIVPIRYGLMATTENFVSEIEGVRNGDIVIMRSERGIDHGVVAGIIKEAESEVKGLGEVMRKASEADLGIIHHIEDSKEPEEQQYCSSKIAERKLPMKLIGVEHLFSGDKIIFYFLADGRVDFRELVKDLARRYRTRIEMRQIGVRDEARLLADYEHCGRELCCRTFMRNLEPVTMRMAKTQKTTLDPSKISGHCGRLMCCLRFEDKVYEVLRSEMPRRGDFVVTPDFKGTVVNQEIIKQTVLVNTTEGGYEKVHISEIIERRRGNNSGGGQRNKKSGGKGKNQDNRRQSNDKKSNEGNNEKNPEQNKSSDNKKETDNGKSEDKQTGANES